MIRAYVVVAVVAGCDSPIPTPSSSSQPAPAAAAKVSLPPFTGKLEVDGIGAMTEFVERRTMGESADMVEGHEPAEVDTGVPELGAIIGYRSGRGPSVHCSAIAISRTAALTAAHCFAKCAPGGIVFDRFEFARGKRVDNAKTTIPIAGIRCACNDDLAIVWLARELPIADHALRIAPVDQGTDLTKLGYGAFHDADDPDGGSNSYVSAGIRNEATFVLAAQPAVTDPTYVYRGKTPGLDGKPAEICRSDSGGPGLQRTGDDYNLVGITKSAVDTSQAPTPLYCSPTATDTSLSAHRTWIEQQLLDPATTDECR